MNETLSDPTAQFDAFLGPHQDKDSVRQEKLPQETRDLLAFLFASNVFVNPAFPIRMTAVEVKIPDATNNVLDGQGGFVRHGGSDSWHYFTHRDDEEWAVVFAHDCDGDRWAGHKLVAELTGTPERCVDCKRDCRTAWPACEKEGEHDGREG